MADFTMEVRDLEPEFYSALTDYPIFDESHREELNEKLFRHYKYREIGFETIDMFVDRLRTRMHEIMPPINEVWRTKSYEYNPLDSVDMTSESRSDSKTTGTANATNHAEDSNTANSGTESQGRTQNYEMPQTANVSGENYATSAADSASAGSTESSSSATSDGRQDSETETSGESTSHQRQHGRSGPAQSLIQAERDLIINIDMLVIDGIKDLFMSVWSANYPYSRGRSAYGYGYSW